MLKVKVVFLESVFEKLKEGLKWDGREKAAHLLCHSSSYEDSIKLMPYKVCVPEESDYVSRSAGHFSIDKPFINKNLNEAIQTQSDFIQTHIHPNDPAHFSSIDEKDELELMRHFAEKIEGIYHGSLVFGNSLDTLDGWFYDRERDEKVPIEKVVVVGSNSFKVFIPPRSPLAKRTNPPNHMMSYNSKPFQERTIQAFGLEAVKILNYLDFV